jgi:hypothetical protein
LAHATASELELTGSLEEELASLEEELISMEELLAVPLELPSSASVSLEEELTSTTEDEESLATTALLELGPVESVLSFTTLSSITSSSPEHENMNIV